LASFLLIFCWICFLCFWLVPFSPQCPWFIVFFFFSGVPEFLHILSYCFILFLCVNLFFSSIMSTLSLSPQFLYFIYSRDKSGAWQYLLLFLICLRCFLFLEFQLFISSFISLLNSPFMFPIVLPFHLSVYLYLPWIHSDVCILFEFIRFFFFAFSLNLFSYLFIFSFMSLIWFCGSSLILLIVLIINVLSLKIEVLIPLLYIRSFVVWLLIFWEVKFPCFSYFLCLYFEIYPFVVDYLVGGFSHLKCFPSINVYSGSTGHCLGCCDVSDYWPGDITQQ
jgi:hypothetical protein